MMLLIVILYKQTSSLVDNRGGSKTCISQLSLLTDYVRQYSRLHYDHKYTFFSQYERVYIAPRTSGYSNFTLYAPSLPRHWNFDKQSGTIWSRKNDKLVHMNITIEGENMWDHTRSNSTFEVETKGRKIDMFYLFHTTKCAVNGWNS